MTRLGKLDPRTLDADQRALYDSIAHGPRARGRQVFALVDADGRLEGPFNAMLLSPGVGTALQELGAAVRYRSRLPDRSREIAVLVVARHWRSGFETAAHEAVGAAAGLNEDELRALRTGSYEVLDGTEQVVARTAAALAARGDLDDAEYAAALALGEPVLFELTTLVGYYATLALQMRVFGVDARAPEGPA